jgi:hypothetical protein
MANRHYGEIGDIWKHLPLAAILVVEGASQHGVRQYWESHAGAARYAWRPSLERDYGAYYFFDRAREVSELRDAAFVQLLEELRRAGERYPVVYPGSPLIALSLLKGVADRFVFCDLDGTSLTSIRTGTRALGVRDAAVRCVEGDGVGALWELAEGLEAGLGSVLAFMDPYNPLEVTASGRHTLELFGYLSRLGVRGVLWFGYAEAAGKARYEAAIRAVAANYGLAGERLWCGQIVLAGLGKPGFGVNPGVLGCGLVTSHLSAAAVGACERLGRALVEVYEGAVFPGGESGALVFEEGGVF